MSNYSKLCVFLKRQNKEYSVKKRRVYPKEQVDRFFNRAPDNLYLMMKLNAFKIKEHNS